MQPSWALALLWHVRFRIQKQKMAHLQLFQTRVFRVPRDVPSARPSAEFRGIHNLPVLCATCQYKQVGQYHSLFLELHMKRHLCRHRGPWPCCGMFDLGFKNNKWHICSCSKPASSGSHGTCPPLGLPRNSVAYII